MLHTLLAALFEGLLYALHGEAADPAAGDLIQACKKVADRQDLGETDEGVVAERLVGRIDIGASGYGLVEALLSHLERTGCRGGQNADRTRHGQWDRGSHLTES